MEARFNLTHENAKLPSKKHDDDVGLDVYGCENITIPPYSFRKISTGLIFQGMENDEHEYYIRVAPRSGIALKYGIDVLAGVVDKNYRGEIGVVLMNNNPQPYTVSKRDRIAQFIFEKAMTNIRCIETKEQQNTTRNDKGFGSSGK